MIDQMFKNHYKTFKIRDMADLRSIFPDGKANEFNWLFASTSGVHGTYANLDDIEKYFMWSGEEPELEYESNELTVIVVHPRICALGYGSVEVQPEDVDFLRGIILTTIDAVKQSQIGNT